MEILIVLCAAHYRFYPICMCKSNGVLDNWLAACKNGKKKNGNKNNVSTP